MSNAPIRVGLIGAGFAAWDLKVPSYAVLDDVEIVAVADPSPEARERAQRELGIPAERCYADPLELVAAGGVDMVDVSTPHHTHCAILVAAAEAGIPIACDKPLAMSLREADLVIGAAERTGTPIGMLQNFRWFPSHARVAELVAEGAIGTPTFASVNAVGVFAPDVGGEHATSWRLRSAQAGGGILIDYGIHVIYLARAYLGGAPFTKVTAHIDRLVVRAGDVEDHATLLLETASGAYASVSLTWGGGATGNATVFGSDGALKVLHEGGLNAPHNVATAVAHTEGRGEQRLEPLTWERFPLNWYYRGAIASFVARLRGTDDSGPTADDGRADLEVVLAAYRSAATGVPVTLPLPASDPVYQHGAAGLRSLDLPEDSVVLRRDLFRAEAGA